MSETIRHRDSVVFDNIAEFGKNSIRNITQKLGLSKSAIFRSLKSLSKRNVHPESVFWETEAGRQWLNRFVVATLYEFGIKGNHGAEKLSTFFKRVRLEKHIGISPTALRHQLKKMEMAIAKYQEIYGKKSGGTGTTQEIIASGDETFFNDMLTCVLMDLSSGYLIAEEAASDRSYETWKDMADEHLNPLGLEVRHFVSDRAKALIKLALSGFGIAAGAYIFHFQYEISKWLGPGFGRMMRGAKEKVKNANEHLEYLKNSNANQEEILEAEREVGRAKADHDVVQQQKDKYRNVQQSISKSVHTFSIDDNSPKTSAQVKGELQQHMDQLQTLAAVNEIEDKKETLDKVRKQISDLASIVDVWWLWAIESLVGYGLGKEKQDWLLYSLLPVIYWYHQMIKADNSDIKREYKKAWKKALSNWHAHPMTLKVSLDEINQWWSWAEWITGKFQRASSPVEGRNGYLSQMYHNGRGLSKSRLKALTVIHNFDLKRRDGTTAAQRLFNKEFPDLFDWIVDNMGALPVPRQPRKQRIYNPLNLQLVPA